MKKYLSLVLVMLSIIMIFSGCKDSKSLLVTKAQLEMPEATIMFFSPLKPDSKSKNYMRVTFSNVEKSSGYDLKYTLEDDTTDTKTIKQSDFKNGDNIKRAISLVIEDRDDLKKLEIRAYNDKGVRKNGDWSVLYDKNSDKGYIKVKNIQSVINRGHQVSLYKDKK